MAEKKKLFELQAPFFYCEAVCVLAGGLFKLMLIICFLSALFMLAVDSCNACL